MQWVSANEKLVRQVASPYRRFMAADNADLVQEATIAAFKALIAARKKGKPKQFVPFFRVIFKTCCLKLAPGIQTVHCLEVHNLPGPDRDEKPDYETARSFLSQGNFLWNAGIFMWSAAAIVEAFKVYQPGQYNLFEKGLQVYNTPDEAAFIEANYPKAENISIDYAILEQSDSVFVLPAGFDWNDLGTWGSLYEKKEKDASGNARVQGGIMTEACEGNTIRLPEGKIAVLEGLKDYIVVDSEKALLILPKSREQEIKQWVARVKAEFGEDYI